VAPRARFELATLGLTALELSEVVLQSSLRAVPGRHVSEVLHSCSKATVDWRSSSRPSHALENSLSSVVAAVNPGHERSEEELYRLAANQE